MSAKKPKVVLTRYKSPTVAVEADGESDSVVRRKKRRRRPLEVPRWLALAPALFFGALGLAMIGVGVVLKLGLMAFYNFTAGDVVENHPDRALWGQLVLNRENFLGVLWALVNGVAALGVCSSWLWGESRRALKLTAAMIGFLFVSSGVLGWAARGWKPRSSVQIPAPAAVPQGVPAPASGFPPLQARGNAAASPGAAPNAFDFSIFLAPVTDAERTRIAEVLKREFLSLGEYVPGTIRIEGNTLWWRSTIPFSQREPRERHKSAAIGILRRNNIRLSDFSEQWLKSDVGKQMMPNAPR